MWVYLKTIHMKNRLQVTPLKKYKSPRYPSYRDQSPLLRTNENTKAGLYATAFLGVFGLFAFSGSSSASKTVKENPIKFKELGFPHTYAAYGTGLPDRLDRETAVGIIDSIFSANKIKLLKEVPISKNGVSFNATGYNKTHDIGYVWLDHKSTTPDCYNSWRRRFNKASLLPEDLKAYKKLMKEVGDSYKGYEMEQDFFKNLVAQKGYYRLLELQRHLWGNEALQQKIETYINEHPNRTDANYGKEILDTYNNEKVDLAEMEQLTKGKNTNVATLSLYDNKFAYYANEMYIRDEDGNVIEAKGDARQKAIENLENLVQDYIDWAKSEGRF